MNLELSNNHIAFFDKLEKSNNVYENIIKLENVSFEYLHRENILKECVSEGGYWEWFVAIINKYGIVPYFYNQNVAESSNLYNYEDALNVKSLSKEEALNLYDISMHHVMTFTGVNVVDDKPERWKIEDSYGNKEKVNGYYIMNDNFFNEFVLSVVIDKKYLSQQQLDLLTQEPIEFDVEDPF